MICIFSNARDYATGDVLRWLNHLGRTDVLRINHDDHDDPDPVRLDCQNEIVVFRIGEQVVPLSEIEIVWYRKGKNWLCDHFFSVDVEDHKRLTQSLSVRVKMEELKLAEYLHYVIQSSIPALGAPSKSDLNKLIVLSIAREVGLKTPDSYITNSREGLETIVSGKHSLITKAMSDGLYLFDYGENKTGYFTYTEDFTSEQLRGEEELFSPSLLQPRIDKKYELRIFYLEGICYASAIFSQSDEQTKTDFRKYNEERPNRNVPFQLPETIEQKIRLLFERLKLNTGSVDIIVDVHNEYYFLEINPVGQFGMVSETCNYYIEQKIATYLMQHGRKIENLLH